MVYFSDIWYLEIIFILLIKIIAVYIKFSQVYLWGPSLK